MFSQCDAPSRSNTHAVVMNAINHLLRSLGRRLQEVIEHPYRRSLKERRPFHSIYGVLQYVKNANLMLQCEECEMWCLLYAKSKLTVDERTALQKTLEADLVIHL